MATSHLTADVDTATGHVVLSSDPFGVRHQTDHQMDERSAQVADRGITQHRLHPLWVRERSVAAGAVNPTNRQRLYEPTDLVVDLAATEASITDGFLHVTFSDGHRCSLPMTDVRMDLGWCPDPEDVPDPTPWRASDIELPTVAWTDLDPADPTWSATMMQEALGSFFRLGFFVLTGAPTVADSLHEITARFGRLAPTNFGAIFDVESKPNPADLAYTAVGLSAHLDQPYRRPTPGIQFLHTLVNDAPGGDSTVTDGLAATQALRAADPQAFDVLSTLRVEFRYDIGTDVVVGRAPMIELDGNGQLRQLRFSTRLDFAPAVDPDILDIYYRGRRWLAEYLNDPANNLQFKMHAGDVVILDNHRVLHGRTAYDPSHGHRHLQGCYIDHDGPATMWRLAVRQQRQLSRHDKDVIAP